MPEPNAFTGAQLDRAADRRRRDEGWLAEQRAHPYARAVVLGDAGVRARGTRIELVPLAELDPRPAGTGEASDARPAGTVEEPVGGPAGAGAGPAGRPVGSGDDLVLLGLDDEGPLYALDENPPVEGRRAPLVGAGGMRGEAAPEAEGRIGLRAAAQTLGQADGGLVAYAAALLNWHRATRFCGVCGGRTAQSEAGMTRICGVCGTHHHPRADPVVIMLVTDGDRVLLGRQSAWPARRYSALAGFVSPGESLDEAVAREVLEEVGVVVGAPEYHSSQPWPFPVSLMLGFVVPYVSGEIGGTDDELEDARWFGRDEVRAAVADDSWDEPAPGDGLLLPPRSAIARRLIESWVAG